MTNKELLIEAQLNFEGAFPNIIAEFENVNCEDSIDDNDGYLHISIFYASTDQISEIEKLWDDLNFNLFLENKKSLCVLIWDIEDTNKLFSFQIPSLRKKKLIRDSQKSNYITATSLGSCVVSFICPETIDFMRIDLFKQSETYESTLGIFQNSLEDIPNMTSYQNEGSFSWAA